MKRVEIAYGSKWCRPGHFLLLAITLIAVARWHVAAADNSFSWFKPANGSFNDPNGWEVIGEEIFSNGTIKDPNPNKKIPGDSDSVSFSGDFSSAYEVSIFGGAVKYFAAQGTFGTPSLNQPVTFSLSGTLSAGYLSIRIPVILEGAGELYARQSNLGPNQVGGMTVRGGSTLRVEDGNLSVVNLVDKSTAILSDVMLGDDLLTPAMDLTDSTLKTGSKIRGQTVNLHAGSLWEHNGSGFSSSLSIATLNMEGGSRFNTEGKVTLNNLSLKESSTFTAGSLTNPVKGISASGSGLFAQTAILNGGLVVFGPNNIELIMSPADITKDSKVELGTMELEQGWLRVSDRSKLRNGTAKMGTKGSAGILVDDKGSEWTVTNRTDVANVRVRRGGFVQFGNTVNKLSALVENADSELRFVVASHAESLRATGGAIIRGDGIDLGSGSSESSTIYVANEFNLGLAKTSSFGIAEGGYLECDTSIMGADEGGSAAVTVSGKHSLWLIRDDLSLGETSATGFLTIDQGGKVVVGPGPDTAPAGGVTIGGQSSVVVSGLISLFDTSSVKDTLMGFAQKPGRPAEVKVLGGGSFTARKLVAGYASEANITIQGANSSMDVSDELLIGSGGGTGKLTIREGALGEAKIIGIGASPGKESSALVTGPGSTLTAIEGILIGVEGAGVLTLADQASLSLENSGSSIQPVLLGVERFSKGTFVIDGGSSADIQDRGIRVGYDGVGILSVSAGGSLKVLNCTVGFNSTSSGAVVVTGTAKDSSRSSFHMQDLYVGFNSENLATFDINASGAVRVAKTVRISPRGTLRFNDGSLSVGLGGDSAHDCTLWVGGTLILEPGGNLIGGPGEVIFEGGTITTIVPRPVHPGQAPGIQSLVSAQAASTSGVATISSGVTMKANAITVVQFDPSASGSGSPALRVTGPVVLGGKLTLEFINGFAPLTGQKFKLFDFQSTVTGQFAQIEVTGLASGFQYEVRPDASGLFTFTALNDGVAISPPQLSIVHAGGDVTVSWPSTARGYILQSTKVLRSTNWQPVPSPANPIKVSSTQSGEFFRLLKP